ncbi:energy transducer TonB [Antarcticimicrobium luteum]|uniref:TonB family protein n=1 Tax=Antarcticimicrobium luteum TaxID=2547397 RepID=A0A4R5V038_9RHOB|nr:energy transducer TonB [Antarcticimicrobium luteum]TDK45062.1 TonB family protein [Antarcticimicrobium luteum]
MSALAEKAVFGVIAAGLHVLALAALPGTGAQSGGAGGTGRVTLEGASPQIAAMVAAWTAPPEMAEPVALSQPSLPSADPPAPDLPPVERAPRPPATAAQLPDLADAPPPPQAANLPLPTPMPAPSLTEAPSLRLPQPEQGTEERPEITIAPSAQAPRDPLQRPKAPSALPPPGAPQLAEAMEAAPPQPPPPARSETPAAQRTQAAAQAQQAAGRGGAQRAGTNGKAQQPALGSGQRHSLIAAWGARIIDRIERTKRAPRGLRGGGRVVLRLQVSRSGALQGVSIRSSSGNAEMDAAAINAVRRAGRFPPAPEGLTRPVYSFSLPVRFNG